MLLSSVATWKVFIYLQLLYLITVSSVWNTGETGYIYISSLILILILILFNRKVCERRFTVNPRKYFSFIHSSERWMMTYVFLDWLVVLFRKCVSKIENKICQFRFKDCPIQIWFANVCLPLNPGAYRQWEEVSYYYYYY